MKANTSVLLGHAKQEKQKPVSSQPASRFISQRRLDELKCALLNKKENWILVDEPQ